MASQGFSAIHLSYLKGKSDYEVSPGFCALLLIIVFLITFLLACHIYMCTHRDEISDHLIYTNQNRALSWTRSAAGLDAATIGGLPTFVYESSVSGNKTNQDAECCICLGIFQEGDELKVLPRCHHGFHCECVDLWLRDRSSCPLCRASVLQDWNGNSMAAQA